MIIQGPWLCLSRDDDNNGDNDYDYVDDDDDDGGKNFSKTNLNEINPDEG